MKLRETRQCMVDVLYWLQARNILIMFVMGLALRALAFVAIFTVDREKQNKTPASHHCKEWFCPGKKHQAAPSSITPKGSTAVKSNPAAAEETKTTSTIELRGGPQDEPEARV